MEKLRNEVALTRLVSNPKIKQFLNWVDSKKDLIWVMRKDYINVYYAGLVYAKISGSGATCRELYNEKIPELIKMSPSHRLEVLMDEEKYRIIKNILENSKFYNNDKERKKQQQIYKNSKKNTKNGIYFVDFELALSKRLIDKKAEIDLLAVHIKDGAAVDIYAIEYKCTAAACKGDENGSGILGHCNDFMKISINPNLCEEIIRSALVSLKLFTGMDFKIPKKNIKFALLFTDTTPYKTYFKKAMKRPEELYIWNFENENIPQFHEPKLFNESICVA